MENITLPTDSNKLRVWLNPPVILGISIAGYLLDSIKGTVGNVFNFIGLLGLVLGLILLIRTTAKREAIPSLGWLLLVVAIGVGIFT